MTYWDRVKKGVMGRQGIADCQTDRKLAKMTTTLTTALRLGEWTKN